MSCVVFIPVLRSSIKGVFTEMLGAYAIAAGEGMGLAVDRGEAGTAAGAKSVALCLDNAPEATAGVSVGQKIRFRRDGVAIEFSVDENGQASIRASGHKSEAELRELGEALAKRIVQQYAYHRIVTEMRERNMNVVEEEVEEDGTVRMLVRVHHG